MFDGATFKTEMTKVVANAADNGADSEELWELYERANIAIQGAWYQGLIDKKTMQETISEYCMAAVNAELAEKAAIEVPQIRRPL